ncbi:N-acetylmuramoyl-L-alanine amidase family protein [Desulforamulus ferrireducens]|uniref:N-acetylmuramoyl-L-alanine amidase n=1 Tax=Desulforamulus ferrireducens TaxID=1833852 RepID=A0A1S6IY40_9FIRM|nr:N-acetylmuramoyl-L-alanine amidase [Desulforamulus ferrireducens]AQS59693.1 N-acetylmuramoyl-L-alanine amidase [Desulforamulus ferrireducens]
MARKILVLDPGHGGRDPGAIGHGLLEKDITLKLAQIIANGLANYDVTVRLTREGDIFLSLDDRAAFANKLGADYFLSIHVNAGGGTGFESFIYNGPISSNTSSLRSIIHQNIVKFLKGLGIADRGEKRANFAVLRETTMPACLLEILFIDSEKDAIYLKDTAFMKGIGDAIIAGVVQSLKLPAKTSPTPTPTPKPTQPPTPIWNPQAEVQKLIDAGIIVNDHPADAPVTWGEFATVLNRILNKMKQES